MTRIEVFGWQALKLKSLFSVLPIRVLEIGDEDGREISFEEAEALLRKGVSEGRIVVRENSELLLGGLIDLVDTRTTQVVAAEEQAESALDLVEVERIRFVKKAAAHFVASSVAANNMLSEPPFGLLDAAINWAIELDVKLTERLGRDEGKEGVGRLTTGDLPGVVQP